MKSDHNLSAPSQSASNSLPSMPEIVTQQGIEEIVKEIHAIAEQSQGDPVALLHLLRTLEQLHRDIQSDYFHSALPDNRQALYALLRNIEENGGWPYIQRWKLQALFANLPESSP